MLNRQGEFSIDPKIGERLRAERKATGLNQADFAKLGGVSLHSQHRFEAGGLPSTEYLLRIGASGVDWLWVLTGQRSGERLSSRHSELTTAYDRLHFVDQLIVDRLIATLQDRSEPPELMSIPGERPLVAMFEAMLAGIKPSLPEDDKARLLAQRLPIALAQLQDLRPGSDTEASEAIGVADPTPHPESTR